MLLIQVHRTLKSYNNFMAAVILPMKNFLCFFPVEYKRMKKQQYYDEEN